MTSKYGQSTLKGKNRPGRGIQDGQEGERVNRL